MCLAKRVYRELGRGEERERGTIGHYACNFLAILGSLITYAKPGAYRHTHKREEELGEGAADTCVANCSATLTRTQIEKLLAGATPSSNTPLPPASYPSARSWYYHMR